MQTQMQMQTQTQTQTQTQMQMQMQTHFWAAKRSRRLEHQIRAVLALTLLGFSASCVSFVTISQKTALEHQLMGPLMSLSDEEFLYAAERSGDGAITDSLPSQTTLEALGARQRQIFNRDEIQELQIWGCLGERRDGNLSLRPCQQTQDDQDLLLRVKTLVDQAQSDRKTILSWLTDPDEQKTPYPIQEATNLHRQLILEEAPPGTPIQQGDGLWSIKR